MTAGLRMPPIFAWVFFAPGAVLIIASIVRLQIDGLTILGTAFLIIWAWMIGVFTADFWSTEIDEAHPDARGSLDRANGVGVRRPSALPTPAGGAASPSVPTRPSVDAPPAGLHK